MFQRGDKSVSAGESMVHDGDIIESFGQYLKREREVRNVPLEEIAAYTRIKLRALEAIEKDDFSQLPPLAFIRAFIRCYADYLGLNINEVMLNFDAFIQQRFPEMTGEIKKTPKKPPQKQNYFPLAIIITVVVAALLIFWLTRTPDLVQNTTAGTSEVEPAPDGTPPTHSMMEDPEDTGAAGTEEQEDDTGVADADEREEETVPENVPFPESPAEEDEGNGTTDREEGPASELTSDYPDRLGPPRGLATFPSDEKEDKEEQEEDTGPVIAHSVSLSVDAPCWIRYRIDGETSDDMTLQPGQRVTFEGYESVNITIGNPDGVESVTYNDRQYDFNPKCAPWHLNFPSSPDDNQCASP